MASIGGRPFASAGRMATGEWTPPRVQLDDPADADTSSEDADTSSEVAEAEIDAAEAEMARLVNELRSGLGLQPLAYNSDLSAVARRWSETMRDEDNFVHNPSYSEQYPAGWQRAGREHCVATVPTVRFSTKCAPPSTVLLPVQATTPT